MNVKLDMDVVGSQSTVRINNIVAESPGNYSENITDVPLDMEILTILNNRAANNLIPIFITCSIIMIVGIVGNSLVVHVYWCKMRSSAKRTFILSLALLDLTVCVLVIPFEMYDLRNQVLFYNDVLCKTMRFLEYSAVLSAGFVLVSISFERYFFLCRAFREFSPRKAKIICFICAVIAMIVAAPSSLFASSKTRHEIYNGRNITGCECSMNSEHNYSERFKRIYYYCLTLIFLGCFVVFVILYSIIGRLLWKYQSGSLIPDMGKLSSRTPSLSSAIVNKNIIVENSSGHSQASCSSHKEKNMMVHGRRCIKSAGSIVVFFSVTLMFVLSFLPHITIRLIVFLDMNLEGEFDKNTKALLYNFVVRSYLISNVSNPFIYSILNKSFRKQLKRTFRWFKCCRSSHKGDLIPTTNRTRYYV